MKKKVALTAAAVAMVGTLAVGGTLAWFTDTETATNVVTTGKVDVKIDETGDGTVDGDGLKYSDIVPGDVKEKNVTITNLKNDAYVRATIEIDAGEEIIAALTDAKTDNDVKFNGGTIDGAVIGWKAVDSDTVKAVFKSDKMIKDDTWNLFEEIEIPTTWGNEFVEETFSIKLSVEAIQADNIVGAGKAYADVDALWAAVDADSLDIENLPTTKEDVVGTPSAATQA